MRSACLLLESSQSHDRSWLMFDVSRLSPLVVITREKLREKDAKEEVIVLASRNGKQTSSAVARKASAILRDGRSSARTRSVAASALAQAKPRKK